MNIPNLLTLLRLLLIPLFVAFFYAPYKWSYLASAFVFGLASMTDWLDGYLARRWNQSTAFGAFLDPVADKVMVAVVLVLMVERYATPLFALAVGVIVARELLISALREWMAELGQRAKVAVSMIGKVKTAFQMVAILILLAVIPEHAHPMMHVGFLCLYIATGLTLWSAFIYLRAAWPMLKEGLTEGKKTQSRVGHGVD
jgi:CDP-diacylglycerol---glycerol-3-phosphate 3-phosphatidyltransferase